MMTEEKSKERAVAVVSEPLPDTEELPQGGAMKVVRGWRDRLGRLLEKNRNDSQERLQALLTAALTDNAANQEMDKWLLSYEQGDQNKRLTMLSELALARREQVLSGQQGALFFRRLYARADSLHPLVRLRADILAAMKERPELQELDKELKPLLISWFDVGMLQLRPITWDSPASLLEKLIEYEAVHEINSWSELKHRLTGTRRCYAYFHPRMADIPLIFVEIALTQNMADSVQHLLDPEGSDTDLSKARCANFYSISNTQAGLRGISFGNFLLKRVIDALMKDYPQLKTFVTLSPIPGFTRWLEKQDGDSLQEYLTDKTEKRLAAGDPDSGRKWLIRISTAVQERNEAIERIALRFASAYLMSMRNDQLVDSVARFHLGNGARIERLNWAADCSPKGMQQSCGMMVNYLYELDQLDANMQALAAGKPKSRLTSRWL
ncbi:malonyl-CoA decarboxylase domain-containing protein [Alcaligenes endophyticus]|uniref:Malonyl-CoA decarboxylase n=1 Tax=Alcaligenes endophyticus TaxID=1929088 RepID=A0ABT8EHK2_9BURK|nr:malonyl-CoA decarboxylase family protein [Alcaligenes endophyticus]MCX5589659.1 malonyl-CoA decarboxylase family protein [Alcaligenes endophyticus]MDN4120677.1 malonyl-CoA decarboxylase [Alcaligenes endophyticus]